MGIQVTHDLVTVEFTRRRGLLVIQEEIAKLAERLE